MIWQNPWALLGLAALALPVLIHLLSRKRAVLQKFPSLRFLNATRLQPTRSPHLTDVPLLILRLVTLVVATLALTQPLWLSPSRKQSLGSAVARVIVVDTSGSMLRANPGGRTARDSAMSVAQQMASESQGSLIVQTATPSDALGGASAWLLAQGLRGEVVVVSDFQRGVVDSAAATRVDRAFGVRLVRVAALQVTPADSGSATSAGRVIATTDSVSTRAEWTSAPVATGDSSIKTLARASDRATVDAAMRAALNVAPKGRTSVARNTAIVFDGAPESTGIIGTAKTPSQAWMSEALVAVSQNKVLADAARNAVATDTSLSQAFAVVARTTMGAPVVFATQATVNGAELLVFFHRGDASSFTTPALMVAVGEATSDAPDVRERDATALTDEQLRRLERAPGETTSSSTSVEQTAANRAGLSDARWFWLFVLLLLGAETWLRNKVDREAPAEAA